MAALLQRLGATYRLSVPPDSGAETAFLRFRGVADARAFMAGFSRSAQLRPSLSALLRQAHPRRRHVPMRSDDRCLIDETAGALASGRIRVAPVLPPGFILEVVSLGLHDTDNRRRLRFDSPRQAYRLLRRHGDGSDLLGASAYLPLKYREAAAGGLDPFAEALWSCELMIEAIDETYARLRLGPVLQRPDTIEEDDAISSPVPSLSSLVPPPPKLPKIPELPTSLPSLPALPELPIPQGLPDYAAQIEALKQAALDRVPFCEECARAALAQAQNALNTAGNALDAAENAANAAKQKAQEAAANARSAAEKAVDDARQKAEQAAKDARDEAEKAAEAAKQKAEKAAEDARNKAETAVDAAKQKAEKAAEDARKKAEDAADAAKQKAEKAAEDARGKAEDTADAAKKEALDKAGEARDAAGKARDAAADAAGDAIDTAKQNASDAADKAADSLKR